MNPDQRTPLIGPNPLRRCEAMSPESNVRCLLPLGHQGAHEAIRGAFARASWANVEAKRHE